MRFYDREHQFYCGVNLHASWMYLCIQDDRGTILLHKNLPTSREAFQVAVQPYRQDLAVVYDPIRNQYRCPNGKALTYYSKSTTGQYRGRKYRTRVGECAGCPFVSSCLMNGASRRYLFVVDKGKPKPYSQRMIEMVDSPAGRHAYAQRMGIIEPVFGNIKNNKGMNRFTLRGLQKVAVQWLYYCLVHNIEKIATTGAINRLVTA